MAFPRLRAARGAVLACAPPLSPFLSLSFSLSLSVEVGPAAGKA